MNIELLQLDGKYATIYADPPWMERGGGRLNGVQIGTIR